MDHAGFVLGSYALTLGGVAVFAWAMVRRGRRLARELPDEAKPWT